MECDGKTVGSSFKEHVGGRYASFKVLCSISVAEAARGVSISFEVGEMRTVVLYLLLSGGY